MTISSAVTKIQYSGNGSTTAFAYPFKILDESEVEVVLVSSAGVETIQTITTNYTVSGVGADAGGTVTMLVAPTATQDLVLRRKPAFTQGIDYTPGDPFPAETHEEGLDRRTMETLYLKEIVERSLQLPIGSAAGVDPELPAPVALSAIRTNATATGFEFVPQSEIVAQTESGFRCVTFTATEGQTVFNLGSETYTPGINQIFVICNGSFLYPLTGHFTETDESNVTLTTACSAGDQVAVIIGIAKSGTTALASNVSYTPSGSGAVATDVQTKLREFVSVKDFGAVGDGVTDDTAAIQAALDYGEANNVKILGGANTYLITSTVTIACDCDFSESTFNVDATSVSTAVQVGPNSAGTFLFTKHIDLGIVINTARVGGKWGTGVGVYLANLNVCEVSFKEIDGFETGLLCGGNGQGFAYNTVRVGFLHNNKVSLKLSPFAGGWANQNTFIGGRLTFDTTAFTTDGYVGTRSLLLEKGTTTFGGPNNNVFLGTSVESNLVEYKVELKESAQFNQFIGVRYEGTSDGILLNTDTTAGLASNEFIGGYQLSTQTITRAGTGSAVYTQIDGLAKSYDGTGSMFNLSNSFSDTIVAPHMQGFAAGNSAVGKDNTASDWVYRLYSKGFALKRATDVEPRTSITESSVLLGNGTIPPDRGIGSVGTADLTLNMRALGGTVRTTNDNLTKLGHASFRWSEVFAATGTINTSDEREKQFFDIEGAEKAAALEIKANLRKFKWISAVAEKGDQARVHFGVGAQQVGQILAKHGLSPESYGFYCYDEWEQELDDTGNVVTQAGNRYGIRYDELLCFIMAAI